MENTVSIVEDDAVLELEAITIEDGDTDAAMVKRKALRPKRDVGH